MSGAPSPDHVVACDLMDAFGPSFTMRSYELPKGRDLYLAIGFERFVALAARRHAFMYGLVAVALSLLLGWVAAALFRRRF